MSPTVSLYRRKAKNSKKLANAFMYSSVLVLIASIASISYRPPVDTAYSASDVDNFGATASAEVSKPSVDQLAVANLAASTAAVAGLSVADEVANMSISLNAKSELAQADETVITKPQVFEPTISKAFSTYATVVGDTTTSLAAAYGITAETLRWANNLTSDALTPGTSLIIPTVDGVVYTTKDGDTIAAVAAKYKADEARIISKNDLELTGLVAGQKILLPAGTLPENERPGYVAPRSTRITRSVPGATGQVSLGYAVQAGNRYGYGYCTWYVYNVVLNLVVHSVVSGVMLPRGPTLRVQVVTSLITPLQLALLCKTVVVQVTSQLLKSYVMTAAYAFQK